MENKFEGRIVGITGFSPKFPNYDEMVRRIIELEGGILSGDVQNTEEWEIGQIIIVGEEDFNREYLIQSIEIGIEHNFTCQYFSLEDFWDFYTDSYLYEPYFEGDPRIENHAGLSFLASLYFEYPSADIFGFGNKSFDKEKDWNVESILKSNFGYSVRKGISEHNRRIALDEAVNSPKIISLQEIAEHIVFLINTRKGNENMSYAVNHWKEDLDWLREEFYDKSIHSFKFPNPA